MNFYVSVTALPYCGIDSAAAQRLDTIEDNPEKAIRKWCELSKSYPTLVSIQPGSRRDGLSLIRWAAENFEKVKRILTEYTCPYRIDWMITEIRRQAEAGTTSMQWDGDQLHPFTMG